MIKDVHEASQVAVRLAIAFFAVVVVAPPILIALCFMPQSWTSGSLIILLLMFTLIGASVTRTAHLESAIVRGLFAAGSVLLVFPAALAASALAGPAAAQLLSANGSEEAAMLRNVLIVYDLAVGAACLGLAGMIWVRIRRQAGLDPNLADAELRQAFWEVRQLMRGRA
jgi:hypothetical protein